MVMQRKRNLSIPRIAPTSFSTPVFRWLHEEGWDDGQKSAFAAFWTVGSLGLWAPPPPLKRLREESPHLFGRWVLVKDHGSPLAAAQGIISSGAFRKLEVQVAGKLAWSEGPSSEALPLLISGLMLLTRADLVRLIGVTEPESLTGLGLGVTQTLLTPKPSLAWSAKSRSVLQIPTVRIESALWWASGAGAGARKTLSYLEKRLHSEDSLTAAQKQKAPCKTPLGFITRFFRWG